jgi:transcriptional regulator with XRE-family HTH domain
MKINEKIRQVRVLRNFSQEFMAGELHIDTSSYCRLEKGVSPITLERLNEIACILRVSPRDLMDAKKSLLDSDKPDQPLSSIIRQLEEEVKLLREEVDRFRSLSGNSGAGLHSR